MNDSIPSPFISPQQRVPLQPTVRIETPVGAIESDSGNHFLDIATVVLMISALYVIKKIVDKYFRK